MGWKEGFRGQEEEFERHMKTGGGKSINEGWRSTYLYTEQLHPHPPMLFLAGLLVYAKLAI